MQISLFFPYLPPYPSAGSMRAVSIIEGLVAENRQRTRGHKLVVYTATKNANPIDGVELICLPMALPENTSSFLWRLWVEFFIGVFVSTKILLNSRRRDVAFVSSPMFVPSLMIGLIFSVFRRRYIVDVRDLYPLVYAEAGLISSRSIAFRILQRLEKYWFDHAHLIFAATEGLSRHVRATGTSVRVVTAYNGFPARLAEIEAQHRERFTVCFHGILGQFQDVDGVIEVARLLVPDGINVVVVGYGPKEGIVSAADLPNLSFRGRLPFDDTIRAISTCHIGLCLRRDGQISRDAFPVKVWECLGLGLPSIVSPHCEAGEFLEKYGAGVQFPAGDFESIADWIRQMRDDPKLYARYSEKCRLARTSYTREHIGIMIGQHVFRALDPIGTEPTGAKDGL